MILVRPDGYVAFVGGEHASARHLDAYCRRWLVARDAVRAATSDAGARSLHAG